MAVILYGMVLAEEVDRLERRRVMPILRRRLRDVQDPFELPEKQFRNIFCMSREMAHDLVDSVRPRLQRRTARGLSVECQVLTAVRFFATGSYQGSVGQEYGLAGSQPSVSNCIRDVTQAVIAVHLRQWVTFPASAAQRASAKHAFAAEEDPLFGTIGAIDCMHVVIVKPSENEEYYLNHHGSHSLNVEMICDRDLRIVGCYVLHGGSWSDEFVWSLSPARKIMRFWYERGERGTWFIGDSGYPLEPWLLTPIPNAPEGSPESRYSEAILRARNPIEHCFGVLKSTWRCLSKQRSLMYEPIKAGDIVNTCVVLHNMRLHYKIPLLDVEEGELSNAHDHQFVNQPLPEDQHLLAEAWKIQEELIRRKFTN